MPPASSSQDPLTAHRRTSRCPTHHAGRGREASSLFNAALRPPPVSLPSVTLPSIKAALHIAFFVPSALYNPPVQPPSHPPPPSSSSLPAAAAPVPQSPTSFVVTPDTEQQICNSVFIDVGSLKVFVTPEMFAQISLVGHNIQHAFSLLSKKV